MSPLVQLKEFTIKFDCRQALLAPPVKVAGLNRRQSAPLIQPPGYIQPSAHWTRNHASRRSAAGLAGNSYSLSISQGRTPVPPIFLALRLGTHQAP